MTRFSEVIRKFATDVRLEGKGWGGEQVARAGFAWASSADRVVANAGGCCSFPSARLGAEGKRARTGEVGLKQPSWTARVRGCLSNGAAKTRCDICRLSVRENLIADTKARRRAGESPAAALFPLFAPPLNLHVPVETAHCNALHVCG